MILSLFRAVAGGAVPVVQVWLEEGEVKHGFAGHANSAVVEESVIETARRIRAGEKVYLHRYGLNWSCLVFMIENDLYPKGANDGET